MADLQNFKIRLTKNYDYQKSKLCERESEGLLKKNSLVVKLANRNTGIQIAKFL